MGLDNPLHIAFLLVILLLVFGAKRLPELGRSLGTGLRGFKETINPESSAHELVSPTTVNPTSVTHETTNEPVAEHTPAQPAA